MRIYETDDRTDPIRVSSLEQDSIRPESALESLLHANPQLILDERLLIVGRQVRLDSGVADLIALDEFGNVVVIEVKIGRSGTGSASEETILSQPQTYASSLSTFDYESLNELYQEYQSRLDAGEWEVAKDFASGGTLQTAVETTFGTELRENQFNTEQRMVVVAEEITQRTAANARYLLESGLHFQCTEVRQFIQPDGDGDGQSIIASTVVVDYDLSRVRPTGRSSPTYPELAADILERAFPEFRDLVEADSLSDVLPDGMDTREHRLISNNPAHPESVVYRLDVKPDQETILIGIDVRRSDDEALSKIQADADVFFENDFEVTENTTYRVVVDQWALDNAEQVYDVIEDVADRYARLVQLGHDSLVVHEEGRAGS